MGLKNIINDICEYSIKNELCNTAIGGLSLYDINFKENNLYDIIFVTPSQNHVVKNNLIEYNLRLYYFDRLLRDNSNNIDILTASVDTLKRLINIIKELNGVLKVNDNYQIVNFADTQRLSDNVAGSYADITITALNTNGICDSDAILPPDINVIKTKFQNKNVNITENGDYNITYDNGYDGLKEVNVNVDVDTDSYYEDGYNTGIEEGKEIQKELLTDITIVDNGTYSSENGYKNVEVNVDVNTFYERGVEDGKQEIIDSAQILNVTSNGTYDTKYSKQTIINPEITGKNADGSNFYDYAVVKNKTYDTQIVAQYNSRLEFWFKPDANDGAWTVVIGAGSEDSNEASFQFRYYCCGYKYKANIGYEEVVGIDGHTVELTEGINHIIMSIEDGVIVNDKKIGAFYSTRYIPTSTFYINGIQYDNSFERSDDGYFGMIIIDGNYIVPTAEGFKNLNTNELLPVINDGDMPSYEYFHNEEEIIFEGGELIKQVNVKVENPLKFPNGFVLSKYPEEFDFSNPIFDNMTDFGSFFYGNNTLTKIKNFQPKYSVNCNEFCRNTRDIMLENCDFSKCVSFDSFFAYTTFNNELDVTNYVTSNCYSMKQMFRDCNGQIKGLDSFDTSNVVNMEELFYNTNTNLDGVRVWDTSNVNFLNNAFRNCGSLIDLRNWDWSTNKAINLDGMFYNCENLEYVFDIDVTSCREIGNLFYGCKNLKEVKFKGNVTFFDRINTSYMFEYCNAIERIYIPQLHANTYTRIIENKPSQTEIVYY